MPLKGRKKIRIKKKKKKKRKTFRLNLSALKNIDWKRPLQIGGILLLLTTIFLFSYSIFKSIEVRRMEKWKRTVFKTMKVEIYNASGYTGLAKKLTWYLRDNGIDVIYYGNAREKLDRTVIVDRVDSTMKYAKILSQFIGGGVVKYEPDADRLTTITILIGKDFYEIMPEIKSYRKVF